MSAINERLVLIKQSQFNQWEIIKAKKFFRNAASLLPHHFGVRTSLAQVDVGDISNRLITKLI